MSNIKKKCPFRKAHIRGDYNYYGNSSFPLCDYIEQFQYCIEHNCMAFYTQKHLIPETHEYEDEPHCKLME